ncbi:TrmH family RNA methyltransferase [Tenuifilum thalassicum]|uniref:RNA methyltransferase n=1 Tax=Tenuifilum thalassicum TaxID=2590900 RepID=A0A7D3XXZ4_9BACT|nr:RNA methyltransferase [Tenuifilum thalassicum]QKG81211.1 RNA methyltransferase [Tenuifilum thalassicum]
MLTKNAIKHIKSLSQKKFRRELGLFVAEGVKLVDELIAGKFRIKEVYRTEAYPIPNVDCRINTVSMSEMKRISNLVTPTDVLAIVAYPTYSLVPKITTELVLALDTVQDPGNLGTIIRLADWFGIDTIVCSEGCADAFSPKTIQATMGAIAHVKIHYTNLEQWLKQQVDVPIYGACMAGENIYSLKKSNQGIIVMGNEGNGISPKVEKLLTHKVTIPSFAKNRTHVESLNVAMATAIFLSEFQGH